MLYNFTILPKIIIMVNRWLSLTKTHYCPVLKNMNTLQCRTFAKIQRLLMLYNNTILLTIYILTCKHSFLLWCTVYTHDCSPTHKNNLIIKFVWVVGLISKEDKAACRDELLKLAAWCSDNNLAVNTKKTREITVRPSPPLHQWRVC